MTMMIIPIIFMIVLLMLFLLFLMLSAKQDRTYKTIDNEGKIKQDQKVQEKKPENAKAKDAVEEKYKKEDVFKFMEFDRILDNMIVQNGGSRFTMAIQCKGINYDLMSEVEQLSVEEGFITFLNTLKYPIQLYVQAQNVDLKGNIQRYKDNIVDLTNDYNEISEKYNKLASAFDSDERELERVTKEKDKISNVYEYAHDIIKYVEKMSTNKNLLQRKFFVLISYNTSEINAADKFNKDEIIDMCSTELITRCKGVISALSSCSVSGKILTSNELADLLYSAYNRDDKSLMSVKEALESGMLRLYSTSEDAFERKEEKLEQYLRAQAQLRAYKAIKYAKEHDEIQTSASQILNEEEEISRRATNYVKNSDYPEDEKEKAVKKILVDYREDKKTLSDIHEVQKQTIIEESQKDIERIPELEKVEKPEGVVLLEKSQNMRIDPITGEVIEVTEESKDDEKSALNQNSTQNSEIVDNNVQSNNSNPDLNINNDTTDDSKYSSGENIYSTTDEEDDSIV